MPKLKINNTEIEVAPGTSILQAAEMLGIEIPRFCYHDKLSVAANCRMCLVEVKGAPKPVASCALACGDNMEVYTKTPMADKARRGVMEMLLINHPLDCPVCDQGGECDLQDQSVAYGFDRSRYHESKRAVKDKDIGPLVKTVMTRCIQCTRCVRFCDEIAGTSELGLMNRGENVEIGPFVDRPVTTELSGNLVDICPVGALTNKPYAFKARAWEIKKTDSVDVMDAVGSNIRVDSRGNEALRILPRLHEDINEEWIGDRSRYAVDGLKYARLDTPYVRDAGTGALVPASWDDALAMIASRMSQTTPDKIAAFAGELCALEEMVALKDLMDQMGAQRTECRVNGEQIENGPRGGYLFNTTIAGIEQADAILIVGANPRHEATMVNARIRKAWLAKHKRLPIGVIGTDTDLTYDIEHISAGPDGIDSLLSGTHPFSAVLRAAKNPMMIVGMGALRRVDGVQILKRLYELAGSFNMIRADWNGWNILHIAASMVGGMDIGFTSTPFDICEMDVVYLMNTDTPHVVDSMRDDAFVVYQGHHGDRGAARADVILPGAAYTEKNGIYVNMEGRAQQARAAVHPPGLAREDWKIIRALSGVMGYPLPYDDLAQLRARMARTYIPVSHMGDVRAAVMPQSLGRSGTSSRSDFISTVPNYYDTNVITHVSKTMKACVDAFLKSNHRQAA